MFRVFIFGSLLWSYVSSFSYVVVPGFGGSVLMHGKTQAWPPSGLHWKEKMLDVWCNDRECWSSYDLRTLDAGSIDGIKINNAFTYLLTKNNFYGPLLQCLKNQNASVSALSYDFRMIFNETTYLDTLYTNFQTFLQKTNGKHVVICHSLGGLLFHHFLTTRTTPEWQKRYITKIYFINTPFGGCPEALYVLLKNSVSQASRRQFPFLNTHFKTLHHFAGLYWCLPVHFNEATARPVLRMNGKWYTDKDIVDIFDDADLPISRNIYLRVRQHILRFREQPVHVQSFIVYGTGQNTTTFLDVESKTALTEDGDRIVPRHSLEAPRLFFHSNMTFFIQVAGMDHSRVEDCQALFEYMGNNSLPCYDMILYNTNTTDQKIF